MELNYMINTVSTKISCNAYESAKQLTMYVNKLSNMKHNIDPLPGYAFSGHGGIIQSCGIL